MAGFFSENLGTIIILAAVIAVVALIIVRLVKNKRNGKPGCGYDCSCCGGNCSACASKKRDKVRR